MTDKELLELAAKAAGIELDWSVVGFNGPYYVNKLGGHSSFRPLDDDGDALRLAVKLGFGVIVFARFDQPDVWVGYRHSENEGRNVAEELGNDPYAATRRAIVRAAAEIGKNMK